MPSELFILYGNNYQRLPISIIIVAFFQKVPNMSGGLGVYTDNYGSYNSGRGGAGEHKATITLTITVIIPNIIHCIYSGTTIHLWKDR